MKKEKSLSSPFCGKWRITEMELWDRESIDLVEPAFIRFDEDERGEFGFIAVHGFTNWEAVERGGKQAAEFSWGGEDEMMPVSGRGWVVLDTARQLSGRIYFHNGDNSGFTAARTDTRGRGKEPRAAIMISKGGAKKLRIRRR